MIKILTQNKAVVVDLSSVFINSNNPNSICGLIVGSSNEDFGYILGTYENDKIAKKVLLDIAKQIENGKDFYTMPLKDEVKEDEERKTND